MSNSGFNLPGGLKAGPLTIDAVTGAITTAGNVQVTGVGKFVGTNAPGAVVAQAAQASDTVKLLLSMDGANGSTTFTDSSLSARTISRGGNVNLNTSIKKYGTASAYFDGDGDYLYTASSSDFAFGTGDFTFEFWFYPLSQTGTQRLFAWSDDKDNLDYESGKLQFYDGTLSGALSSLITINQWHHAAVSRCGGTVRVFLDGTSVLSRSSSSNTSARSLYIGAHPVYLTGTTQKFNGYIDDIRVVKGVALYTTNFTPPTSALTTALNEVKLLLNMNGTNGATTFTDSSTYNKTVTPTNATLNTATTKYGTASARFTGTNSYLTVSSSSDFDFGFGDFTIECWYRRDNTTNGVQTIFNGGTGRVTLDLNGGDLRCMAGATTLLTAYVNTRPNIWTHIAVSRSGTTLRLFINGFLENSVTNSTNFAGSANVLIGGKSADSGLPTLFIDDLRVTKGQAIYTSDFELPTSQLASTPGTINPAPKVSLLFNMNGSNDSTTFTDSSVYQGTYFLGTGSASAKLSTSVKKYGTASGYFAGGSISLSNNAKHDLGTKDFTIECWVYITSQTGTLSTYDGGTSRARLDITDGYISFVRPGWVVVATGTTKLSINTWHHIAACRSGTTLQLFLNGVLDKSITDSTNFAYGPGAGQPEAVIGGAAGVGYIDDLRVIRGQALYTSDFTPPAAELTTTLGTPTAAPGVKLLLNMNGVNGSTTFTDSSIYARTVTANGNAQLSTSVVKYGTASAYFDGSGDYLRLPASTNWTFGTGDFTVEAWVWFNSTTDKPIISNTQTNGTGFYFGTGNGISSLGIGRPYQPWTSLQNYSFQQNTWYHVAATRSGTSIKIFVNGTQIGSTVTSSQSFDLNAGEARIGNTPSGSGGFWFNGYIDDVRIVKGQAVYTANFTPPGAELTTTI